MTDWLTIVLLGLVAFRLTRLVTTDVLTEPLRRRFWARWPADDTVYPDDAVNRTEDPYVGLTDHGVEVIYSDDYDGWVAVTPTLAGYLVSCDLCASVWVSLGVTAAAALVLGWGFWLGALVWGAVAGLVYVVVSWV